ncbi:hypothetical protein, partial [Paenibacillus macerans]
DSGDPLPPADRTPTEPAPCGCGLIVMFERWGLLDADQLNWVLISMNSAGVAAGGRVQAIATSRSFRFPRVLSLISCLDLLPVCFTFYKPDFFSYTCLNYLEPIYFSTDIFFSRACLFLCCLIKRDNRAKHPDKEC